MPIRARTLKSRTCLRWERRVKIKSQPVMLVKSCSIFFLKQRPWMISRQCSQQRKKAQLVLTSMLSASRSVNARISDPQIVERTKYGTSTHHRCADRSRKRDHVCRRYDWCGCFIVCRQRWSHAGQRDSNAQAAGRCHQQICQYIPAKSFHSQTG